MMPRVLASEAACTLIRRLLAEHGPLMFYLSHGCCDGSTPMLFKDQEMTLSASDVPLGEVEGVPFFVSEIQLSYLASYELLLDVQPGSLGTFSLEDAEGQHFVVRSHLCHSSA
ncbi:MAG TPA: DUF779 domain-containing protein [Aquabacterium sp.]|nr:DUF779 domain-containing protein [Aquabacterium sp.]